MKYTLHLNEEQARVLIKALDFYSRIGIGQFREIVSNFVFDWCSIFKHKEGYYKAMKLAEAHIDLAKKLLTKMPHNASLGISSPETPETAKVAYDLQQVIRHKVAWTNNPEGGHTVDFHEPMKVSEQELPTMYTAPAPEARK